MPDWKQLVRAQLAPLRLSPERELEIVEELALHLEAVYEAALAAGAPEPEAYQKALAQVHDGHLLECELSRAERPLTTNLWHRAARAGMPFEQQPRGGMHMESLWQDLRYGWRMLSKAPGVTLIVVLTLALGIGANAAVFTLINAALLRALPAVQQPHELVILGGRERGSYSLISFPMYRDLRARQQVFTDILASGGERPVRLTIPGGAETVEVDNVRVSAVTANYFSVLGVRPTLGRFFSEDEDRNPQSSETAGSLVILSDSFWERQFGRDPKVLERTVLVDRSPCRVIGVTPRGFYGDSAGSEPDAWVPLISFTMRENLENRRGVFTSYLARLKPGVSVQQAQTAMTLLFQQLKEAERAQLPPSNPNRASAIEDFSLVLQPGATGFNTALRHTFGQPLWIVLAIVALVLLIACANVANLLLARAAVRQREISVRLALGCGRLRLIRQLLTESLLLSALGALAGLFVAWWGSPVLLRMVDTGPLSLRLDLSPDARVLAFMVAVTLLTGLLFGLAPAWRASGFDLASAMKDQSRSGTGRRVKQYLGRTLVVLQVALSLLLLIGAGLLIHSLYNLQQVNLGFRPQQVLLFELAHNPQRGEPAALAQVARAVHERVKQVPGVQQASLSFMTLFGGSDIYAPLRIQDYPGSHQEPVNARYNSVSAGYFETVGMRLLEGRDFDAQDAENAPRVAVVNESLARRYFGQSSPLGRLMEISAGPPPHRPIQIIGVVSDAKYNNLRAEVKPMFYMPLQQLPRVLRSLEVRTTEPSAALAAPVRQAVLDVTKDVMIRRVLPLSAQIDNTLASERLIMTLCTFFGLLALLLASIGLYGVLSYGVAQRTHELGIRMALGATGRNVLWLVLRQSLAVVFVGIALGLGMAIFCTRLIASFLYGLSPTDPAAIVLSLLLLLAVALLACYLPARRATKVDPLIALRHE
jgi:predicted permease